MTLQIHCRSLGCESKNENRTLRMHRTRRVHGFLPGNEAEVVILFNTNVKGQETPSQTETQVSI